MVLAQRFTLAAITNHRPFEKFLLNGLVYDKTKKLEGVTVKIFKDSILEETVLTDKNGAVQIEAEINHCYIIEFNMRGRIEKRFFVDAVVKELVVSAKPFYFSVDLFRLDQNKPEPKPVVVAKISYVNDKHALFEDKDYTKRAQANCDKFRCKNC